MTLKLGVIIDPLPQLNIKKDSTIAMLLEAQKRNWLIQCMEQRNLFIKDGKPFAKTSLIKIDLNASPWFSVVKSEIKALADFDVILMRKDPPFDMEYIYTTHLLDLAETAGCLVVNKPQSLRDANEKLFTSLFPQCCPPSLVSRDIQDLKAFLKEQGKVVFKPLDSMGGKSIFLVTKDDPNVTVILETLSHFESRFLMAQKFIPEITQGDKRILLINGEPIPYALARIPKQGDIRGNLAAGAHGVGVEINPRDQWICQQLGPTLREKGLLFVGIDVIGDYLTEINVTSPTCIREIDKAFNINISAKLLDVIQEQRLAGSRGPGLKDHRGRL